jgi:hypothetical protein
MAELLPCFEKNEPSHYKPVTGGCRTTKMSKFIIETMNLSKQTLYDMEIKTKIKIEKFRTP